MKAANRRSVVTGLAAAGLASAAGFRPSLFQAKAAESQPLRISELIDARSHGNTISLTAQSGTN